MPAMSYVCSVVHETGGLYPVTTNRAVTDVFFMVVEFVRESLLWEVMEANARSSPDLTWYSCYKIFIRALTARI